LSIDLLVPVSAFDDRFEDRLHVVRDPHGYGFTRGFGATGPTVTGTVPDFDTRVQTVPVAAVSRCTVSLHRLVHWQHFNYCKTITTTTTTTRMTMSMSRQSLPPLTVIYHPFVGSVLVVGTSNSSLSLFPFPFSIGLTNVDVDTLTFCFE